MMSAIFMNILTKATKKGLCLDLRFERLAIIVVILSMICSNDPLVPLIFEAGELTPVVNTSTGPIRGEVLKTIVKSMKYSSFRSIRYAEPPIGYQRFKPPNPVKPWTNVLNATVEASACPQVNLITTNYVGSEDCLFVNVFTPLTSFEKGEKSKAVMVWIHGGSFISGNARTIMYGPDFLMEDDVILVTFNYRIGPLGFLSLNHPNATGNAGMKDQVLALKWINQNIEKFGGDTSKITIFGNSAGAACVDLHTLSDRSQGLFHGVISVSASALSSWAVFTLDEAINKSFELGSELGISTTSSEVLLRSLYEASVYEIAQATFRMKMKQVEPPFRPVIEDPNVAGNHAFLTVSPLTKYMSGNFTKVPYVTGYTTQEAAYMVSEETITSITDLVNSVITRLGQINQCLPLTYRILRNLISEGVNAIEKIPNRTREEWIESASFKYFIAGIDVKQRFLVAQSPEPVYYYHLSFNPMISLHKLLYNIVANGSVHADDLAYMFYMPIVDLPLDETHPISITRRRVVRLWTNFAKYGNPTPHGLPDSIIKIFWPPSGSAGIHLEIGDELSVGPRPVDAEDQYLQLINDQEEAPRNKTSIN